MRILRFLDDSGCRSMLSAEGSGAFDDQFELRTKLGDGMTASVYVAVHRQSGQLLACKLCDRHKSKGSWSRLSQLMQHENELLRNVGRHPNLVSHHGYYESPWQCAIMLDLVQGGDCQQLLQRQGALSEPLVQSMISELHSALRHLHARSVLHRDVKLENVLCDTRVRPPSVKLCDLGHAMSCHSMETDRNFYGTPGYAAPEVIRGPLWTFAADVWAMGVVMYALLCNALPFEEGDWKRPVDFSSRHWWKV